MAITSNSVGTLNQGGTKKPVRVEELGGSMERDDLESLDRTPSNATAENSVTSTENNFHFDWASYLGVNTVSYAEAQINTQEKKNEAIVTESLTSEFTDQKEIVFNNVTFTETKADNISKEISQPVVTEQKIDTQEPNTATKEDKSSLKINLFTKTTSLLKLDNVVTYVSKIGVATEQTFDAVMDLVKVNILGRGEKVKEPEDPKELEKKAMNRQNQATVNQAVQEEISLQRKRDIDPAVLAKREEVNKKLGLDPSYEGAVNDQGEIRPDIEALIAKIDAETAKAQEKAAREAKLQQATGKKGSNIFDANRQGENQMMNQQAG